MEKRLAAVARELNTGVHTLADFLVSKGFNDVSSSPATKITDDMYQLLLKEFDSSASIKKQADEISIGIRPNSTPHVKKEEPVAPPVVKAPEPPVEPKVEPKDEPPVEVKKEVKVEVKIEAPKEEPKKEVVVEAPKVVEIPKVVETPKAVEAPKVETKVESVEPTKGGLKVLGKIDLDAPKRRQEEAKKAKREQERLEAQKPVEQPKIEVKPPVKEVAPVVEPTPEPETGPKTDVVTTPELPAEPEFVRAQTPTLQGLKIMGKVTLPTPELSRAKKRELEKEKEKERQREFREKQKAKADANKPGATPATGTNKAPTTGNADSPEKRKRNRINMSENRTDFRNPPAPSKDKPAGKEKDKRTPEVIKGKDIDEKVRLTMQRIQGGNKKRKFGTDRKTRDERKETERQRLEEGEEAVPLQVMEFISVSDLASIMDASPSEIITACMKVGVFVSINQRLEKDIIELVASDFGFDVEFISAEEQADSEMEDEADNPADLVARAPIVTVMGHVDHGKTSLLDYIRKANVVSGEAGGITQHIGAYEVNVGTMGKVTFLDTPGHEAFTAMRARGAKVTDIAIIIIAADDSIMPQTKEAISHAQAAGVPMVFAINKIDKDGANPEKIKEQLASMNILVEDWGGSFQSQDISAKKGLNVDLLLEKILLQAELLELKANPARNAVGTVIEASLDKGRGYVTKLLVQNGTLSIGDPFVAGAHSGKVKAMFNERGVRVKEAGPSTPVLVLGLDGAPQAGEKVKVMETEQEARQLANKRAQILREQEIRATKRITLTDIGKRLAMGSFKQLNLIVKGDFDGSVEALSDSLLRLGTDQVAVNIVYKAVGQITESDVLLASASDGIIVGFQVRPSTNARRLAENEGVEIKTYSIIYEAIDEIKAAIEGMLEPTKEEKNTCNIEVREVFNITKVGNIAGCFVQEGVVTRNTLIRVIRDGIVVFPVKENQVGELASLKRFKDDVKEVKAGFECGLNLKNFEDIRVGDIIEGYEIIEVKQKL